jgi:hypothetical protein
VLGGGGVGVSGRMQDLYPREGRARPGWLPEGLNAPIRLPDGLVAFLEVGGGSPSLTGRWHTAVFNGVRRAFCDATSAGSSPAYDWERSTGQVRHRVDRVSTWVLSHIIGVAGTWEVLQIQEARLHINLCSHFLLPNYPEICGVFKGIPVRGLGRSVGVQAQWEWEPWTVTGPVFAWQLPGYICMPFHAISDDRTEITEMSSRPTWEELDPRMEDEGPQESESESDGDLHFTSCSEITTAPGEGEARSEDEDSQPGEAQVFQQEQEQGPEWATCRGCENQGFGCTCVIICYHCKGAKPEEEQATNRAGIASKSMRPCICGLEPWVQEGDLKRRRQD